MEAALVGGFIRCILPRLFSLAQDKYKLQKGLKGNIEFLEKELRMIAGTIDEQASLGRENNLGAVLSLSTEELRDLAHKLEDCIDRFLYQVTREQQASPLLRPFRSPKTALSRSRQRLAAEVQHLRKVSDEAHQREKRYRVFAGLPSSSRQASSARSDPHTLKADLVGIEGPRDELVAQLAEEADGLPKQLKVISIVGIHGSGKTVLAREVYESDVGLGFLPRAWVSAAERSSRELLMEILRKLGEPVLESSDVDQLTLDLRKHLDKKRYLFVIDDMQTDQWSTIEAAFPEANDVSSRVIVTTTVQSVANACSSSNGYVHKIKRLSDEHSEQLFMKKACPKKYLGYMRPESKDVLKKCDGQPLALVSMGQFLRKKGWPTEPGCEDVCRHLCCHLETDETLERMQRVLTHSFSSLSGHGPRSCLLYLGMFPTDHPIRRKSLMRQWLAEGFVETEPLSSTNFNTLIDRNIIEPIDVGSNDQVKTCKTYGMMREFILHMSTSLDFITLFTGNKIGRKNARRLSLHHKSATGATSLDIDLSLVRSLIVFGEAGQAVLNFQKYELLRVLDLEHCTDLEDDHLKDICNLLLLKYLSLGANITCLPAEIENLKLLETLDLRRTKVKILSIKVLMLPCLVHLFGKFQFSDKVKITSDMQKFLEKGQSNLETMAGFVTDGFQVFPHIMSRRNNLRKVKIYFQKCERDTNSTDLRDAIQKFIDDDKESSDPRSLSLHFKNCSENILNSLKGPCYLRSLKLKGKLLELPQFVISMRGLQELCLSSAKLTEGLLAALSNLTDLQHLKLIANELEGFTITDQAFPRLLHLCFVLESSTTLPKIEEGALPYLISLKLICKDLVGLADININSLRCLKEVTLDPRVSMETIKTWKKATNEHLNKPEVLFFNPVHGSESQPADHSVASTPAKSEVMEASSKSEGEVQEDDSHMQSQPAHRSVASMPTKSEVMEASSTSDGEVQEDDSRMLCQPAHRSVASMTTKREVQKDDSHMLVDQKISAMPDNKKQIAAEPRSIGDMNSDFRNIDVPFTLTELPIAHDGKMPSCSY